MAAEASFKRPIQRRERVFRDLLKPLEEFDDTENLKKYRFPS